MKLTTPLGLGAVLFLSVPVCAQVSKNKTGYLFRVNRVVGQTFKYAVTIKGSNRDQQYEMTGPATVHVKGKKGTDSILTLKFGPLSIGNRPVSVQNTYDFLETPQAVINGGTKVQQMWPVYPKGPIKPGATWEASTSAEALESLSTEKAIYRFVRMTRVAGRDMAELGVQLSSRGQADTAGSGKILIQAKDGTLWSSTITLSFTPPNASAKTVITTSLLRQP